jgi:type II secretory pathway pseudopilin PulG
VLPAAGRSGIRIALGVIVVAFLTFTAAVFVLQQKSRAAAVDREAAMRVAVASLRHALESYRGRHGLGPPDLAALVREHDLSAIPIDPVTRSAATWRETREEQVSLDDFQSSGGARAPTDVIVDIRSGAPGGDSHGRRWSEY